MNPDLGITVADGKSHQETGQKLGTDRAVHIDFSWGERPFDLEGGKSFATGEDHSQGLKGFFHHGHGTVSETSAGLDLDGVFSERSYRSKKPHTETGFSAIEPVG
jgi:hypothetical protein